MGKVCLLNICPLILLSLNIIEILWRFIKTAWLPFSAFSSFKQLVIEVDKILSQIGEQFQVQFAT
jgi:hypothetical protein